MAETISCCSIYNNHDYCSLFVFSAKYSILCNSYYGNLSMSTKTCKADINVCAY